VLGSLAVELNAEELAVIESAVPAGEVAGDRYDSAAMAGLDSERGSQS
jgi:hypothetical protein